MAKKFKPTTASRINESTDFSVKEIVRSKIIKYAQDRLNKSGAVLLAPVYDMINFNDPLDGMISFDYLNTIAENEELSEDESGYDYIEQAVTDIANFIQNQGFIIDEDSDDPLVFIDENYDEEDDEELDDMNESVKWTETDEPNQWVNKLTKNKEAIDPITLECKDLGVAVFASKLSEDADNNFYKVMIVNSNTGKSMTKSLPFDGIDLESAISKLKKCDNKDDLYDTISKYLFLRKSDVFKLFGISMNEAVSITKADSYKEFNLLPPGNKFMDPIKLENKELGIWATAGVMFDEDDPDNEDDYSAVVLVSPLDPKYENYVVAGDFSDNYSAAKNIMKKLAQIKTPDELAKIIKDKKFSDYYGIKSNTDFLVDVVRKLYSKMNESTVMNESAQIRPCDPALEGFDLLDSNNPFDFEPVDLENTELGFYAIAGVATGANPSAVWVEDDCSIEICITALDPDYTDEVLVAEYYDVDYKAMNVMQELASATSYNKLTSILVKEGFQGMNSGPFDFVDDLEAINSMNEATEVPDGRMTVELDDTDVVEGDTLLLAELTDDVFNAVNTVLDELDPDADVEITIDNEDLLQLAVVSDEDLDDDAFDQVLSELLEDMDLEDIVADMTDSEPIEDPDDEDFGRVIQYINFYPATGATVVPDNSVMDDNVDVIEDEDVINESFKLNTDLTKFVDKLADSFFGSIKDANFLNLEDEDGNLYFQVSTGDKSYSRKLLTNFLAFLAKKNVDFDLVNKVNVTGNSTFWNATVIVKINNKQGSQVQYRNELNESTNVSDNSRIDYYVDDLNFKSGVKFLDGDDKIEKVLKAISTKLDIRSYPLDKLPWVTYTIDGKDKVAVLGLSGRLYTPLAIAITDGKNISDFINNSKSILVFTNKKLEDRNNITIAVRIMNNLAKATDRASEYKAIKSLLDKYEKQVYNYEQFDESTKSPKLPTQSELKTIIQKSMIKFGERHTQVTVHAYRTSKYEGGVVEVDLDGTSLATDGREEDYYDEDNIKNALEYASKELVDKFGQDKDLLDYIDVQYNKVGSLTITFSLDSELNESYSMNEATKVTFHFDDQKDWVSPEDFKKIEKFAPKMEDALERYLRRLRDLGPDDKLKDQVYTEIRVENKEKIIIETKTKKKVLKKDIDRLYAKGNGPSPSTNLSQLPLDEVKATSRGIGWGISPIDKSLGIFVYTGFKSLAEPWDPAKAKAEWDAAHPKKPASALKSKLEEIAKGIEKYVKSHPDYKKFNLNKDVVHVGEDYIKITVDTQDAEVGKSILIDTDKFISKNYKDLETHSKSKDGSKPVWSVYVMKSSAAKDLMNESTKFDFDNLDEVLEEDLESDIDLPDYADNIIVNSYATGYGYGVKATFDDRLVKDNKLRIISRIVNTISSRCGKDYDLNHHHDKMRGEYSLTLNYKGSPINESANYKKLADKLESSVDNIDDSIVINVDQNDYGYDIIATFNNSLLGSNPNKIINKIVDSIVKRNGKYSDLVHYNNKVTGEYKVILSYKGQLNECAIIGPDETDIDSLRANELSRALSSDQPLVDPYDIRCTIRPVFVRKDQFLFDGSTVYKATANASTDKDSGTTEIKVDVLLSDDPDITDASMTLTLPTEFDGLKLLRGNPTKVYNESADVKADTVTLSFANEDEANEFIKDNGVKPEKSFEGKFGWTVILKKSDLKKIK